MSLLCYNFDFLWMLWWHQTIVLSPLCMANDRCPGLILNSLQTPRHSHWWMGHSLMSSVNSEDLSEDVSEDIPEDSVEEVTEETLEDDITHNAFMPVTTAELLQLGCQLSALAVHLDPLDGSTNVRHSNQGMEWYFTETCKSTTDDKSKCLISHLSGAAHLLHRTQRDTSYNLVKAGLLGCFGITRPQKHL